MRMFWVAVLLMACGSPASVVHAEDAAVRIDRAREKQKGPKLIAKGEGYTIHGFLGSINVPRQERLERNVAPGAVLYRTDTETGEATYLLTTGTYAIPTRRASFIHSRLVGLLVTDKVIVMAEYRVKTWDDPPGFGDGDVGLTGGYTFHLFDREAGQFMTQHMRIEHATRLPKEVPGETLGEGVILPSDDGFSIFGAEFKFKSDGRVEVIEPEDKAAE